MGICFFSILVASFKNLVPNMEEAPMIQTQDLACTICKTSMYIEDLYCPECGYPEKGTEREVALYHARRAMQKNQNMGADKKIKSARNILYVMAGIVLVFGFFGFFEDEDVGILITNAILGVIYLLLGAWTSKKPLAALLLGLFLYLTTVIISAIFDPSTVLRGIIFKIIITVYLGVGVYSASSIKK